MQHSRSIEAEVHRWINAIEAKDARIYSSVSREAGTLIIGAAPGQWSTDPDATAQAYAAEAERLPSSTFSIDHLMAHQEGTVGWAAVDGIWTFEGMEPLSARLTMVFHKEGTAWKVVLLQTAFALPDEKVFGG